jgi:hypothetical protein
LIKEAKTRGYLVGNSIAPSRQDPGKPESVPESYQIGRTQDIHGKPLWAKHQVWNPVWGCPSSEEFLEMLFGLVKFGIDAGADYVQVDGPELYKILSWGGDPEDPQTKGCFCDACQEKFREYLSKKFTADTLAKLGVKDASTFDYKQYLLDGGRNEKLREAFETSFRNSSMTFWPALRKKANQYARKLYPFSCNNSSYTKWGDLQQQFDFALGELSKYDPPTPASLHRKMMKTIELRKAQAFTLRSKDAEYNRRVMCLSYSLGAGYIVPWDVWISGFGRYFGEPNDFNDITGFIRDNSQRLDGYEYTAAVGSDLRDDWYGEHPPVQVTGNTYAFVRAKPGEYHAPAVVHLLDWNKEKQPFTVRVNGKRFFRDGALKFTLLVPQQQNLAYHKKAEKTKDFSKFTQTLPLTGKTKDGITELAIPKLNPWALLIVENK